MSGDKHQNNHVQNNRTALVFGATGKQGGAVAAALKARGWTVRALVRRIDIDPAQRLASVGVELHAGDFSDPTSVQDAMVGAHGVFSVQPNSGSAGSGITDAEEVRFGKSVADLAVESGVRHLVYTSASIISRGKTGLANLDTKLEIEHHIRNTDIASTIIRPSTFMDLFTLPGMGLDQGTFSFFTQPTQAFDAIAVEDIGRITAMVMGDSDRYAGRTIEIAGDALTGLELAAALTKAAGRPIIYQKFAEQLLDGNELLGHNARLFAEGRASGNADIAALQSEFGDLLSVGDWLSGPGKVSLAHALSVTDQTVTLR